MKKQYTRKQIQEAISYWKGKLRKINEATNQMYNGTYVIYSHYEYGSVTAEGASLDAEIPLFDDNDQPIYLIEALEKGITNASRCSLTTVSIYEWENDHRGQKLSASEARELYEILINESTSIMKPEKYI